MSTPQIPWRYGPGRNSGQHIQTVRSGERWLCCLLGEGVQIPSVPVHWPKDGSGAVPCLRPGVCSHCPDPDIRWKGYAPVVISKTHYPFMDRQSLANADDKLRDLIRGRGRLRAVELTQQCHLLTEAHHGQGFWLARAPGKPNNPLHLEFCGVSLVKVPPEWWFDPTPLCDRVFARKLAPTQEQPPCGNP